MKLRLDRLMIEKNIIKSREKAKAYIMEGLVFVDGQRVDKPGEEVDINSEIILKDRAKYVSRGGLKLEKALKESKAELEDKICLDIGSLTGGFTDCILKNAGKKVYAVDVGYGQLDYKLRQDEKVVVVERTNARYLTKDRIKDKIDFFTIDVSFISVRLILPVVKKLIRENAKGIILIKPQFEAGREKVGKNGVVRDKNTHIQVIEDLYNFSIEHDFIPTYIDYSPIKGPKGNIEYLMMIENGKGLKFEKGKIKSIVDKSHEELKK